MNIHDLCVRVNKVLDTGFFEASFGKKHALLKPLEEVPVDLITEEMVEAIVRFSMIKKNNPKVFFYGNIVKRHQSVNHDIAYYDYIMRLHSGGASVVCDHTQKVSNQVFYFAKFLERIFECNVHGNMYMTPSNMTAFNPHYDKHDVLVLQLRGSKKWSFYKPLDEGQKHNIYKKEQVVKIEEFEIKPGQLLYIPQGLVHAAESTNETSWHLTLGLTGYLWRDALKDLIDAAATPKNMSLLRPLPILNNSPEDFQEQAIILFEMMKDQLDFSTGLEKFKNVFPNLGKDIINVPAHSFEAPESFDDERLFEFIELSELKIEESEERLTLKLPSRQSDLYLKTSTLELLNRMKSHSTFSAVSLKKEESLRDLKLFLSFLKENGLVKPVET